MSDLLNELRVLRNFLKRQGYGTSARVVARAVAELTALRAAAQAIEAHRAETHSGSVADESAVHAVDAPGPDQPDPAQSPSTSDGEG